jgi:hypothetical protein
MDWASTPDRNLTACLQPDPSRADLHPMDLLYSLAESIFLFMDSGPGLPMTLLCLVIAGIPVTLLHELGHAIAAYRLLGSEVDVSIGTVGKVAEMRLGEVAVSVHALSGLSAPLGCSGRPRPACSTTSSGPRHSPAPSPSSTSYRSGFRSAATAPSFAQTEGWRSTPCASHARCDSPAAIALS